jgi:class 3 adenylate cyclase/tetratricopeptide (TPR) repeat protein
MNTPANLDSLLRTWEERDPTTWRNDTSRYIELGRQAIALGQYVIAADILDEALGAFPDNATILYCSALALARSGARGYAMRNVERLLARGNLEPGVRSDAFSLAGRIAKDRMIALGGSPQAQSAAEQARGYYLEAWHQTGDFFPGINAATLSLLTGHAEDAQHIARDVKALCLKVLDADHWLQATLGEAAVLLGEREDAAHWYTKARDQAGKRYGDLASMRRQLRLLAPHTDLAQELSTVLDIPRVALFTGHMIDAPGRSKPRFPARLEATVQDAIANTLEQAGIGFAYCAAACGADILFIEQALARNIEVNVVMPFGREDFIRTSVAFAGSEWVARFDSALARAATVTVCVDEGYLGDDVLFGFAAQLTQGLVLLRARQLETDAVLIAVAEADTAPAKGGTWANVLDWRALGLAEYVVDLRDLRSQTPSLRDGGTMQPAADIQVESRAKSWGKRQIKTMLFADVVGFSKLQEASAPAFYFDFLGRVAHEIEASAVAPIASNTWGDGLFIVYDDAAPAVEFALRLRDAITRTDWLAMGLPQLTARIAMHTGPVFQAFDPVIKNINHFGSHVNRAARIEPVTAPGSVYITEQTAAMLTVDGNQDFACDYLGKITLAKAYSATVLYRVRRAAEDE